VGYHEISAGETEGVIKLKKIIAPEEAKAVSRQGGDYGRKDS